MRFVLKAVAALTLPILTTVGWSAEPTYDPAWCNKNVWGAVDEASLTRGPTGAGKFAGSPIFNLTLSGGGYRAMLFHVGVLKRLNDSGLLGQLKVVSSVSGGSITAGLLAHRWTELEFDEHGKVTPHSFKILIEGPLRRLAERTLDWESGILGMLLPIATSGDVQVRSLDSQLFGEEHPLLSSISAGTRSGNGSATENSADAAMRHPARPTFIFNATNVMTGEIWQFRAAAMGGNRTGWTDPAKAVTLAQAIAASSAFPPFLSPVSIKPGDGANWYSCPAEPPALKDANAKGPHGLDDQFEPAKSISMLPEMREITTETTGEDVAPDPELVAQRWKKFQGTILLMDGGVRDNLGLGAIEELLLAYPLPAKASPASAAAATDSNRSTSGRAVRTVPFATFVADGGRTYEMDASPWQNWVGETIRVLDIISEEPNLLRVRRIIREGYHHKDEQAPDRKNSEAKSEKANGDDSWAYWSIRRLPKHHDGFEPPFKEDEAQLRKEVIQLSSIKTRLSSLEPERQQRLINWGYIATQHGMPYIAYLWQVAEVFKSDCKMAEAATPANPGPMKCWQRK